MFLLLFLKGAAKDALYCAHRTSTFLSCAFCEQEGHLAVPFSFRALREHGDRPSYPTSFFSILLRSVACVDADIVERQICRPDVSFVAALPKPHRDCEFLLAKDLRDAGFSGES